MPMSTNHWTMVARAVSRRLASLDKQSRAVRLREEARNLGLEPHTLRRYVVLIAFLERLGVRETDASRLPLGPLEVVLRIWNRDSAVAARALRAVRDGRLSFRQALAIEKRMKERLAPAEPVEPSWDPSEWLLRRVARALDIAPNDLVERDQLDDPRFDLVQAQRIYEVDGRTVAFLDEAAHADTIGVSRVARLVREALTASALYDETVVAIAFLRSADIFVTYLELVRPEWSKKIRLLEANQEDLPFGAAEDDLLA